MNNLRTKIEAFIESHPDLVAEYDSMQEYIPIHYSIDDIIECYTKLKKINPDATVPNTLRCALKYANEYGVSIIDAFENLSAQSVIGTGNSENIIQSYFREINDIYNRNNNDFDIEYCEENRDKLLEMNLKTVISVAKKYQGLGLDLADLISAGNVGLVTAWEKYDPNRSKIKEQILNAIEELPDKLPGEEFRDKLCQHIEYGDINQKIHDAQLFNNDIVTKAEVVDWVEKNIKNAKFNSIAVMWIRAYILIEIDKYSRVVKKPKSEITLDKEIYGAYKKESLVNIDDPIGDDDGMTIGDRMLGVTDDPSDLDVGEAYDVFKDGLKKLLTGVKTRDRGIFLKKFGIGIPRPMTPKEIAEQEGLSIARVSQILQTVVETMHKNQVKYNIDPEVMFDAVRKFY